jgi:hypothetical protein
MKNLSEIFEIFCVKYTDMMTLIRRFLETLVSTPHECYLCHSHTAKLREVTSVLCGTIHNAMKKCCGMEVKLPTFIISAMDAVENSFYGHGGSASGELTHDTNIGGWLDFTAAMDMVEN